MADSSSIMNQLSIDVANVRVSTNMCFVSSAGKWEHSVRITDAMVHRLHGALSNLLDDDETIVDHDRMYVSLSTDWLGNAFDGWGLTAGEWRRYGEHASVMLDNMVECSIPTSRSRRTTPFNWPSGMFVGHLWVQAERHTCQGTNPPSGLNR